MATTATPTERPRPRRTTHHVRYTSPLVVGEVVTGFSFGVTPTGRLSYLTRFSGIYQGVKDSEWVRGEKVHFFTDGEIGGGPQRCFAQPVKQIV